MLEANSAHGAGQFEILPRCKRGGAKNVPIDARRRARSIGPATPVRLQGGETQIGCKVFNLRTLETFVLCTYIKSVLCTYIEHFLMYVH